MVKAIQRSNFMANHMGGPVLRHTLAYQAIQCHRRGPHNIGPHLAVIRVAKRFRPLFNQGLQ